MMTANHALSMWNMSPRALDAKMGSSILTQRVGSRGACQVVPITTKQGQGCSEIKHLMLVEF